MQNFEKLIRLLTDNDVEFVLIGGFAAVVHGVSILTHDVDICVSFDGENSSKVLKAIKGIHPIYRQNRRPFNETAESLAKFKNLYLITDLGAVDLLGQVTGIGEFREVSKHTIEVELFNKKCRILDIDALISSKKQMKRPKDKEAIIQLQAIKEKL